MRFSAAICGVTWARRARPTGHARTTGSAADRVPRSVTANASSWVCGRAENGAPDLGRVRSFTLDPVTTRNAVAEFGKPVLLLAGEYDVRLPRATPP